MIEVASACPHCGAAHNPIVDIAYRMPTEEPVDALQFVTPQAACYTYLCGACGESYEIELPSG